MGVGDIESQEGSVMTFNVILALHFSRNELFAFL